MTAGWRGMTVENRANDPLGVDAEDRVREVDLLTGAPGNPLPCFAFRGDLGVRDLQPRRHRVGRGAENHSDAASMRTVEDRLEPLQVELAVARFPCRPHRFADANDGESRRLHEVEIEVETLAGVVLRVVGGAEENSGRADRRRETSPSTVTPLSLRNVCLER